MTVWSAREPAPSRTLSEADFDVPIADRYFEDYQEGAVYEYGYATVDQEEVVAFARLSVAAWTAARRTHDAIGDFPV